MFFFQKSPMCHTCLYIHFQDLFLHHEASENLSHVYTIRSAKSRHSADSQHVTSGMISLCDAISWKVTWWWWLSSTLMTPTGCSPPGSSFCGILQARILEWVAISFFRKVTYRSITEATCNSTVTIHKSLMELKTVGK